MYFFSFLCKLSDLSLLKIHSPPPLALKIMRRKTCILILYILLFVTPKITQIISVLCIFQLHYDSFNIFQQVPSQMSRLMGKPTICIGENKGADQLRGNREADQHLCFRFLDSTMPPLFKLLALFCDCIGRFVSDLFGNHIVGFPTRWLKYRTECAHHDNMSM